MKEKKNLSDAEKLGILKKRTNSTLTAGMVLTFATALSFPLAMFGTIPFDNKLESTIQETGYFEYAEEKKAEYKEQYENNEIPREVYNSYVEYYGTTPAVEEYLKSIGEEEKFDKIEGIAKSRNVYAISVLGVGLLTAFSGLGCLLASRMSTQEYNQLKENSNGDWETLSNLPADDDIFPELSRKEDEDESEEDR